MTQQAQNGNNLNLCESCQDQYVVCIGEAFYDMIAKQHDTPMDKVTEWTPKIGGAPTNFAVGLTKLNVKAQLIACIGNDEGGDKIIDFFNERHIKLDGVQRLDMPTRDVLTTISSDGTPNFGGFSKSPECYADALLDKGKLDFNVINNASILYTGTLGLAYNGSREAMNYAANVINQKSQQCIENGGIDCVISKIFVDLNWRPAFFPDPSKARAIAFEYVQKVDFIKASAFEVAWLLEIDENDVLKNPKLVFEHLPRLELVMVTAGSKGAAYAYKSRKTQALFTNFIPSFPIKVADTAGAGDSFNAGFFAFLLKTNKINEFSTLPKEVWDNALTFAVATSALTCTGEGAIDSQPTFDQVVQFLDEHDRVLA